MTTPDRQKPGKPTPDFPLTAHNCGQWTKKISGKVHYFGKWSDPAGALAKYLALTTPATPTPSTPDNLAPAPGSAKGNQNGKPDRPEGCPLFAHDSGSWAKKINGKLRYFGPWSDLQGALARYREETAPAPAQSGGLTLRQLANRFLTAKKHLIESGELSARTWQDYHANAERVLKVLGADREVESLQPTDFGKLRAAFAKTHGPVALSSDITRTRIMFNFAEVNLIERKIKYGDQFEKPGRGVLRKAKTAKGKRLLTAQQIKKLLEFEKTSPQLKAMILLGINCGLGNGDCEKLRTGHIQGGWLVYPRPKTGIERRCPLWPETRRAIREALAARPKPKDAADRDRVFLTHHGRPWCAKSKYDNPISKETVKLMKKLEFHRSGLAFYALRHTFATVGYSLDKDATKEIMGHAEDARDMSAHYNEEKIAPERLIRVALHVRNWLRTS